ncbi:hypothetical protein LPY66_01335 [Dehalobacter sp. DCM]|uniref:hypothetical protein n=1 Tax=Dehalobacter sp. DCM TaxID=2907827 RepID=UPI0030820DA4|nr:hypothetical protein LPY66_01335 [Dehalobacter sp. DCM]
MSLWLDGSSIVTVHFIAKQSTIDCFMTGLCRSSPSMPSVRQMSVTHLQAVLARPSMSLPLIAAGQIMYLCCRI